MTWHNVITLIMVDSQIPLTHDHLISFIFIFRLFGVVQDGVKMCVSAD